MNERDRRLAVTYYCPILSKASSFENLYKNRYNYQVSELQECIANLQGQLKEAQVASDMQVSDHSKTLLTIFFLSFRFPVVVASCALNYKVFILFRSEQTDKVHPRTMIFVAPR